MIFTYSVHDRGTGHTAKGIPCQDSYRIAECGHGYTAAAIADGLGSCPKSQISAGTATEAAVSFIRDNFPSAFPTAATLTALTITAMNHAYGAVLKKLGDEGIKLEEAHTTLSICIYGKERVVYGHSGDGAVFGLEEDGTYSVLCEPIKGGCTSNATLPFTDGIGYWKVGTVERHLAAVMMATDGVADIVYPFFLHPDHEVIHAHAAFFMHPKHLSLGDAPDAKFSAELGAKTLGAIRDPANVTWSNLTDDVTAVIMVDTESDPPEPEDIQTEEYLRRRISQFYGYTEDPGEESGKGAECKTEKDATPESGASGEKPAGTAGDPPAGGDGTSPAGKPADPKGAPPGCPAKKTEPKPADQKGTPSKCPAGKAGTNHACPKCPAKKAGMKPANPKGSSRKHQTKKKRWRLF